MLRGVSGHIEPMWMVKTLGMNMNNFYLPAELSTKKNNDHSTIGIVTTTDGSFGEIPRNNYIKSVRRRGGVV